MINKTYTITSDSGLHARPATALVNAVNAFSSEVALEANGKSVNLKSIMGVMSLGVAKGAEVKIIATGDDEQAAIDAVDNVMKKEGLGN